MLPLGPYIKRPPPSPEESQETTEEGFGFD